MSLFKKLIQSLKKTPFVHVMRWLYDFLIFMKRTYLQVKWTIQGKKLPLPEDVELMVENVTIIFKSFERQKLAKRLYENIQKFYPGIRVIIADDSSKPLEMGDEHVEVIQMPFNSGLGKGMCRALERVETPYVIRMDDDELLTVHTRFEEHLKYLMMRPEIDLIGVLPMNLPFTKPLEEVAVPYLRESMYDAPKPLLIPHLMMVERGKDYVVVGKSANIFIARTDKVKAVGYDEAIRMLDHHDFFFRAAGNMVSVISMESFVFHYHNPFDMYYAKFRGDVAGDRAYLQKKHRW